MTLTFLNSIQMLNYMNFKIYKNNESLTKYNYSAVQKHRNT